MNNIDEQCYYDLIMVCHSDIFIFISDTLFYIHHILSTTGDCGFGGFDDIETSKTNTLTPNSKDFKIIKVDEIK